MAAHTMTTVIEKLANNHPMVVNIVTSLAGNAMDWPDRAPALATGALPVVRLGTEAATAAAVHCLALQQFSGQIAQDEEVLACFTFDLVHRRIEQGHQPAHRRALTQLRGQEVDGGALAVALQINMSQRKYRRHAVVAPQHVAEEGFGAFHLLRARVAVEQRRQDVWCERAVGPDCRLERGDRVGMLAV